MFFGERQVSYRSSPIDGELLKIKDEICAHAIDYGLDFFPVVFEVCDYDTINILAAHGGFPMRYPHWRFGMEYDQLSKGHAYGTQKIYEMVINTDPCYAYLLNANHLVDQKIVMAHVYGHADFFKNNCWFSHTDRKMMDVMANHGTKIRRYMENYGQDTVENFIDSVLSLENLLDVGMLFENSDLERKRRRQLEEENRQDDQFEGISSALRTFMGKRLPGQEKPGKDDDAERTTKKKTSPRDIMMFLLERAPLKEWQADIVGILREEAYYFLPQRLTKIMNEGWASYWHSTIMTQKILRPTEIVDFADHHAGVMAMSREQINPYKIGIELFRDIEYRWNTGKFGKEYRECEDMKAKEGWSKGVQMGREKIFEIRKTHNDITFIDEFFTRDFCERNRLFTYKFNNQNGRFEIESREFEQIKTKLLASLTNFGQPVIEVLDDNFANRGELLLAHVHHGVDLDLSFASGTMTNIYKLWKRPVNLVTKKDSDEITYCYDGKEFSPLDPRPKVVGLGTRRR